MATAVKIFLPVDDDGEVKVWFEADRLVDKTPAAYTVKTLQVDASGLTGRLALLKEVTIPDLVLSDHAGGKRLKTWAEAVEQAEGEGRRRSAAAFDQLYEDLRKCKIKADGSTYEGATADFFGFTGIAAAATTFHLEINPVGLLPNLAFEQDQPIFRAEAEATFAAAFKSPIAGPAVDAVVRIQVILTREGLLQLQPRVSVPKLPHLGWSFPWTKLTKWSLDGLQLPNLDLQFFQLPLQAELGIKVAWSPQPQADLSIAGGKLKLATTPSGLTVTFDNDPIFTASGVALVIDGSDVTVTASNIVGAARSRKIREIILIKDRNSGPFNVVLSAVEAEVEVSTPDQSGPVKLKVTLAIGRVLIQAHTDPSLLLALAATLELTYHNGALTPVLKQLDVVEPYPIKLALIAAHVIEDGVRRLLSLCQRIDIPTPNAPALPGLPSMESLVAVLRRLAALAAAAAAWLAQQGIAAARALAGLAEAVLKMLGEVIAALVDAIQQSTQAILKYVVVEVRIDVERWRVAQIVITPSDPVRSGHAFTRQLLGFKLDVPYEFSPALVCDFDQGWMAIALQAKAGTDKVVTLSTDLWLENGANGITEPVSGSEPRQPGQQDKPLLSLKLKPKRSFAIALAGIDNGKAFFLKKLVTEPLSKNILVNNGEEVVVAQGHLLLAQKLSGLQSLVETDFDITPGFEEDRILSLFRSAGPSAGGPIPGQAAPDLMGQLSQYIQVKKKSEQKILLDPESITISVPVDIQIRISKTTIDTRVNLKVNLETLSVSLDGGVFDIALKEHSLELLGLKGEFVGKDSKPLSPSSPALRLDLRDGDVRLGLHKDARIDLHYDKLSNGGKGLGFSVDQFIVSRDGIDLDAAVKNDEAVMLAGVDMPFRFDQGKLSVKRSQIQAFAIAGHGNLPPALVGEAKASIALSFVQQDEGLELQAASAVLDKSADPLRCEGTQFSITVTKLGLKFVRQGGYHFYFTLTGAAEFRPSTGAFANGLLKNLSSLKITLNEAPLAADPRVLLNHIEFQVTVDPPKRSTFFDLFSFELRGVGFHPSSEAFGGSPALSISGQVNFTDFGDVVSPRFDFHKLWIAPPEQGKVLPRIRFDGLGVGLSLGSMAQVTGTAIAVDGQLPTLVRPDVLPANVLPDDVTAKGFLASGSLNIQGWASMSASMGFLELEKRGSDERRQAFFLYVQRNDMSEKIPTPIGTFFLREVGFGFGYRYTLAGIAAADQADSPRELVKILDEVSKYQGSLDDVRAWLPTFDNASMTLALRGLFSISSASSSTQYNDQGERELPNLVLFDIVAALRTDLTFLMNVRAWVAYNYADWRKARVENSAWRNSPTLTGYMYLSAPRREFLARLVYNPGAEVGEHPKLPEQLKSAMKAVRWSSTLYIRPGLFHMEYGWPYELGFMLGNPKGNFYLAVEGGTVLRIEDAAVLYGLAFRARGFAKFEYSRPGSFGAAISAHAEFALGAKLIAYLSSNVSESMFYGVIALDVTLEFSVRMWLDTKWFSLSASFSRSLTIHVGIELLVAPAGISGRVEASVVVGAFGRSLSLGIGFPLGDVDRLDAARMRVERFLALGLGSSYPNPEAGVPVSRPTPLPETSRAENADRSDKRVEEASQRIEVAAPPAEDHPNLMAITGREIGDVYYWALLFPIRGSGQTSHYLVQLVPRDASPPGSPELLAATHFYAAPLSGSDSATYRVTGVLEHEILSLSPTQVAPGDPSDPESFDIKSDWKSPFGLTGNGDNARGRPLLGQIFQAGCFMAGKSFSATASGLVKVYDLTDIETIPWAEDAYLPDDPEQASLVLKAAARSRTECGPKWKRVLQIEEVRSCFIATVADCAERLARLISFDANGNPEVDQTKVAALEFDPRAIGLTLVLTRERIDLLFADRERGDLEPAASNGFTVATRMPEKATEFFCPATRVALFNPPERMFHDGAPVLKEQREARRATGILLHWDLEWRWSASGSIYADPEFHLRHYRIERRIENLAPGSGLAPAPKLFEAKKADLIEICLVKQKDDSSNLVLDAEGQPQLFKRRHRSRLQFADDLQDVQADLRAQLLMPATAEDRRRAAKASLLTESTRIVYTVLPIDCAGTFGVAPPDIVINVAKQQRPQKSLLKAVARFHYDKVPLLGEPFSPTAQSFFELTTEEEEAPQSRGSAPDEDRMPILDKAPALQMRIRTERTVAVGVFGADALSQAHSEPPVPDCSESKPGAGDTDVILNAGSGKHTITVTRVPRRIAMRTTPGGMPQGKEEPTPYQFSAADWDSFREALDIKPSERVRAARLYIRPVPISGDNDLDPEWIPLQLQMRIGSRDKEPAVDITIERFEHPLDIRFQALTKDNITPSSGRLHLYHPAPKASLEAFLVDADLCAARDGAQPQNTVDLLRDGERRTAVTLAWNARPEDVGVVNRVGTSAEEITGRHSLIAGFDLFALDATAIPSNASYRPGWPERFLSPLGRVQRLPAAQRGLEPSETGDFARVEVLYPSETHRLKTATFNKRRATWFSPAESCLLWPERVLRRSVLTLPDETDIEALFARGRPRRIEIAWSDKTAWPSGLDKPSFALISQDGTKRQQPNNGWPRAGQNGETGNERYTIQQVRELLLSLVLDLGPVQGKGREDIDKRADEQPNDFANLKITLTAKGDPGQILSMVTVGVALAPSLHPLLADVLDLVQYDAPGRGYRRYEPVLDMAPGVNATQLTVFLDETPADRDPSGWGVLRTLGLAAALRLYDVEEGTFLRADATLCLLNAALRDVLPRYQDVPHAIGAPFVDVMFTTDGLADTASYQGTAQIAPEAASRLVREHALALVQIELRPTPQPLVSGYQPVRGDTAAWNREHRRIVRYATLRRQGSAGAASGADDLLLSAKLDNVLVEIEPLVRSAGQTTRRVLLVRVPEGQKLPKGAAGTVAGGLRLLPQASEDVLAYVRFTALDPDVSLDHLASLIEIKRVVSDYPTIVLDLKEGLDGLADGSAVRNAGIAIVAATDMPSEDEGPWGRFTDLPDEWLALLLFKDGVDAPLALMEDVEKRMRATPFGNTLATLMRVLGRMQNKDDLGKLPIDPSKRLQLVASLGPWTRRFMERGPAIPVFPASSNNAVGLAFAMLTRPSPWRMGTNTDGQLSVTLFEKDRFGKVRKYAVRPFGRYENLVRAVDIHEQALLAKEQRQLAPAPAPPGLDVGAFPSRSAALLTHFADVSIERTEPLSAPLIIATRRNDDVTADGVTRPGRTVEVIVARHPEEILSDANVRVDAGLAMRHVAVGFWREFSAPKWAREVERIHPGSANPIDLLEPFGPFRDAGRDYAKLKKPKELELVRRTDSDGVPVYELKKQHERDWYERHPDLWRGAYVLTLADLPYGFRLHATAHAAAGVVVSPTTAATVGEAGYRLVLPWKAGDTGVAKRWQERKVPSPSWMLSDPVERAVRVRWPLVRIVDGLFNDVKQFWLGEEEAPDVYRLPDPAVSYRVSITTQDGRVRVGEAEFSAIPEDQNNERKSLYLAQAIGSRFEKPTLTPPERLPASGPHTHYELTASLKARDGGTKRPPQPKPPVYLVAGLSIVPAPKDFTVDPVNMAHWGRVAPAIEVGLLSFVITPPDADKPQLPPSFPQFPPDSRWPAFKVAMAQYVAALQGYVSGPGPQRVIDSAAAILAEVSKFVVGSVGAWPGPKSDDGSRALPATLYLPWLLGLPASADHVSVIPLGAWVWPRDLGRDAGLAEFRAKIAGVLGAAGASAELQAAVAIALRAYAVAWMVYGVAQRRFEDETPWHGQSVIRRSAPGPIDTAALRASAADPFDFVASVELAQDALRQQEQVEAAFTSLEQQKHSAEALEGLAALWFEPGRSVRIQLRWAEHVAIKAVLRLLPGGGAITPVVSAVLLRMPALKSETASLAPANQALPELLEAMTMEMLFGPGRRLLIQAFHGLAVPEEDHVERVEP